MAISKGNRYSQDSLEGEEKHMHQQEDDENDGLLSLAGRHASAERPTQAWFSGKLPVLLIVLNTLFLIANTIAWTFVGHAAGSRDTKLSSCLIDSQVLPPTPAKEAVQYELRRFTGIGAHESEFIGRASDEMDEKWNRLIDNGKWFAMDREMFVKLNGNPDTGLRIPNDPEGRFFGMLQVNHQLHCVDIMRRSTWFNIKRYRDRDHFQNMTDEDVILHTNHCVEILRQSLQCHGDTAMLTYNWVHGHDWPQSAWRSLHSCQNWDALNEWRAENDISHLVTHLERPAWVLDPDAEAPGHRGAAEAVDPITCRDLECEH
ncbi:hypothetical protein CGRA01v4_03886 [Colletotrichum graminicola]|uniref:Tat pathway signal sequence n=1 Tax=Colletotrichum graminicola (strain M1.001 / M2 / FGSC 10212) TaxID=645133 RepID=E3QTL6_COLGM|nr:uncharacterized protein GLRG_09435 [Colletotrichum graminicola M1.001]EFQ34291.1 hypothetical protein GLRG_09435 [Colletotrichum graminicola M1.001]WDK12606.1 hypothetical protein CGRA01v4_03886 [Colletotrichum graminicola]